MFYISGISVRTAIYFLRLEETSRLVKKRFMAGRAFKFVGKT